MRPIFSVLRHIFGVLRPFLKIFMKKIFLKIWYFFFNFENYMIWKIIWVEIIWVGIIWNVTGVYTYLFKSYIVIIFVVVKISYKKRYFLSHYCLLYGDWWIENLFILIGNNYHFKDTINRKLFIMKSLLN